MLFYCSWVVLNVLFSHMLHIWVSEFSFFWIFLSFISWMVYLMVGLWISELENMVQVQDMGIRWYRNFNNVVEIFDRNNAFCCLINICFLLQCIIDPNGTRFYSKPTVLRYHERIKEKRYKTASPHNVCVFIFLTSIFL